MSARIVRITPADALYAGELELRYRVLREPLGMGRETVQNAFEHSDAHLVLVEDDVVTGCVLLRVARDAPAQGRLLQMAVAPHRQGRRLGAMLVAACEGLARELGALRIVLHARQTAVGFYARLGYQVFGEPFVEVTLPHRYMDKVLAQGDSK